MIRTAAVIAGAAFAMMSAGCKKNVDLTAADTGAAPSASVATAPATAEAVDAAPLAPLASAPVAVKKVVAKDAAAPAPSAAAAAPATPSNLPECSNARTFCNSPKVGTDPKIKKMCDNFTAECKAKGGSL